MKSLTQVKNEFADIIKSWDVSAFDDTFNSFNGAIADFNKNAKDMFCDFRKNVDDLFGKFDFEDVEKALEKGKTKLSKHFKRINNGDFEVIANFDKSKDDLSFKLEGNEFFVKVKAKDESGVSSFVTTIPTDVDKNSVVQKYDSLNKKIRFIFKKK